jgi:hypothetical protein
MRHGRRSFFLITAAVLALGSGCIPVTTLPVGGKEREPDNTPGNALVVQLDTSGRAKIYGSAASTSDVDFYDLGPMDPGDRVIAQVIAIAGSSLDPVAALFDANLDLINYNDDENYGGGNYNSYIDHTIRHATSHCYLGVTDSSYGPSWGGYMLDVRVSRGGAVPQPRGQTVVLDFSGATVSIPGDRTYTIAAFDAGKIDSRLSGQNTAVEHQIKQILEDRYSGYNIEFLIEGEDPLPPSGTYSTLVFGGRSATMFGLSQDVDHYNENATDKSIIFTDRWTNPFSYTPSTDAIITSIGNVAAHELGHLLGLEHTADITGLMDASGVSDTILVPQEFRREPLYDEVFPLGWQDDQELLMDTLGPASN